MVDEVKIEGGASEGPADDVNVSVDVEMNPAADADSESINGSEAADAESTAGAVGGAEADAGGTDTGAGSPRKPNRRRMVVAAAVCLALAAGGALCVASNQPAPVAKAERKASTKAKKKSRKAKEAATVSASIKVTADGISEGTSPVITHWTGKSGEAEGLEFYHATEAAAAPAGTDTVEVSQGSWEVEVLPSVNADGSLNEGTSEAATVEVSEGSGPALDQAVSTTPADQVTQERLDEVMDRVAEAVSKGDSTLTGEAGSKVVDKVAENASKNPNADASKIEQKRDDAASSAEQAKPQETAKPSESAGSSSGASQQQSSTPQKSDSNKGQSSQKADAGKGNSGSDSTSGGSSQSGAKAEHTHSWVAVTHEEPVYTEQPVYETRTRTVTDQEAYTTTQKTGRSYALFSDGHVEWTGTAADDYADDHGGYRWVEEEKTVTVPAVTHEESYQVQTGTKKVQTGTRTVTDGYKCSKCGATK